MDISIQHEPTRLVAIERRTVPMSDLVAFFDTAYTKVAAAITTAGAAPDGPAVAWYHGMPTDTVDLAAGFPVSGLEPGPLGDGVEVVEIPGGPAITAEHAGGYDGLPGAWEQVERFRAAGEHEVRGDFAEVYLTEPSPDGDPALNRTQLVLPLK